MFLFFKVSSVVQGRCLAAISEVKIGTYLLILLGTVVHMFFFGGGGGLVGTLPPVEIFPPTPSPLAKNHQK